LNAIINLDDISHIPFLEKNGGIPEIISVRYNPGKLREGSFIMGSPENAKYGFTREQIFAGLAELRQKGSRTFGLHTFIASNELNPDYFIDTADMLFDLALEIKDILQIRIGFVNISGGIGIPYTPDQKKVSLAYVGAYSADSATRFRRNPPPSSDPSRQGVPIDSATPGRSVATLVFSSFS
jgi:diaminopimelate decarboxylase